MKDKIRTEYLRRVRKLVKSKLYARNIFMGINQRALYVVRYSVGIVDWTRGDLELLDRKTRKILRCNGSFHPTVNVAGMNLKRSKAGRGLISAKDCVLCEWSGLWDYLKKLEESWMLKEGVKENIWWIKRERKSAIEGPKKRMKSTGREKAYMDNSLNQVQTLQTVFHGNG